MAAMYSQTSFSAEFFDENNNPHNAVEKGFASKMPASIIGIQRGDASFRLESDSLISGSTSLVFKEKTSEGTVYVLDCDGVYKCSIKPAYMDTFLANDVSTELGTISLNDPNTGAHIELVPVKPLKGVTISEETGPWGRMGATITREHYNIKLTASKTKPKP